MSIMSIRKAAKKMMMPVIIILVVALTIGLFYIGAPTLGNQSTGYKGAAVKLGNRVIKDAEFSKYLEKAGQQASQMSQMGMAMPEGRIRDTALSMAIREIAFEQEMKKVAAKIKVSDAEVEKIIKKYFPTEEELQSVMTQQGIAEKSEFRKLVKKQLETQKFLAYKAKGFKVKVSKNEILEMMKQITVSHVLISLKDSATGKDLRSEAEAKAKAEEVYQKLTAGGDFKTIAKEYSDDPGSKDKGGTYGPMPLAQFKSQMVKEFGDAAVALKQNQISQPVKTQYGYHIIKLDGIDLPKGTEYKEKYKEISEGLLTQKAQSDPKFQAWYTKLTKKAEDDANILDPGLRAYRLKEKEKWAEAAVAYKKALRNGYYKNALDVQIDAASVYLKLKQPEEALKLLKKVPENYKNDVDYQITMAKAYGQSKDQKQAKAILSKLAKDNADNVQVHMSLKEAYTELKMTKEAAAEEALVNNMQKAQQEAMQKQMEAQQKQQGEAVASPGPEVSPEVSPAPSAEATPKKEEPKPSAKKK